MVGSKEEAFNGAHGYTVKREEGTRRPVTSREKGLAIPLDFHYWLQVA